MTKRARRARRSTRRRLSIGLEVGRSVTTWTAGTSPAMTKRARRARPSTRRRLSIGLEVGRSVTTWMAGTSPAMTKRGGVTASGGGVEVGCTPTTWMAGTSPAMTKRGGVTAKGCERPLRFGGDAPCGPALIRRCAAPSPAPRAKGRPYPTHLIPPASNRIALPCQMAAFSAACGLTPAIRVIRARATPPWETTKRSPSSASSQGSQPLGEHGVALAAGRAEIPLVGFAGPGAGGIARRDLGPGQPLPFAEGQLAQRRRLRIGEGIELQPLTRQLHRLAGAAERRGDERLRRLQFADRRGHPLGEPLADRRGLGAAAAVERNVALALQPAVGVVVGLAMAHEDDAKRERRQGGENLRKRTVARLLRGRPPPRQTDFSMPPSTK